MKIVFINATYGIGSTGTICEDLVEYFGSSGHECFVFYESGKRDKDNTEKISSNISVKVHSLLARLTGLQGYYSNFGTRKIIKRIKQINPDIVHLHNLHGNYINIIKLLSFLKANNTPTVITLHDCWFFTGKCTHYTNVGCERWQYNCGHCPQLKGDIPSWFFDRTKKMLIDKKKIYEHFDRLGVIAVSDYIAGEARKSLLSGCRIKTIYNWVDSDVFSPKDIEIAKKREKFSVLFVSARWDKGSAKFNDLIEFFKIMPKDIECKLIGRIDTNMKMPENVQVCNFVRDSYEMANYYKNADVYIHLSHEDSFGKVIIESMSCGTPVIVYNTTACPELVNPKSGFVVDIGDVNGIVTAINKIRVMGSASFFDGCIKQSKKYNKRYLLKETEMFYKDIIV